MMVQVLIGQLLYEKFKSNLPQEIKNNVIWNIVNFCVDRSIHLFNKEPGWLLEKDVEIKYQKTETIEKRYEYRKVNDSFELCIMGSETKNDEAIVVFSNVPHGINWWFDLEGDNIAT